jgi:hypothetical protein
VAHELGAERAPGLVLVVRSAEQPDPPDAGLSASGVGLDVVEFQISALLTAVKLEHRRHVARRDVMAEQVLQVAQQVLGLLVDGELPAEAPRRERGHHRNDRVVYPRWRG